MNSDTWISEKDDFWPGLKLSLKIKNELYHEKSDFQDIRVFDSCSFGRVMSLDDEFQIAEKDEFAYQEMIAHIPLFSHKSPKNVLIVGGGDGGVLREVLKHQYVEKVVECEIDKKVVEVCKKYFPDHIKGAYDDKRTTLICEDAFNYLENHHNEFDVIIIDSSDPVGPAEDLYTVDFFNRIKNALRPDGIMCMQAESMWTHLDLIKTMLRDCKKCFKSCSYCYTTIPTYSPGEIGFMLCTNNSDKDVFYNPREVPESMLSDLKYYDYDVHLASFVLPRFVKKELNELIGTYHISYKR